MVRRMGAMTGRGRRVGIRPSIDRRPQSCRLRAVGAGAQMQYPLVQDHEFSVFDAVVFLVVRSNHAVHRFIEHLR